MSQEAKAEITQEMIYPKQPPEEIFQERGFRKDPHVSVAQDYVTYIYDADRPGGAVEYKDGEGIFVYYKGVELPRNGLPFAQAVYAINSTKRLIINAVKLVNLAVKEFNFRLIGILFTSKKKRTRMLEQVLLSLQETALVSLAQFYMKPGYYCKTAKEVWKFTRSMLISLGVAYEIADKTGEILAMIFEYDDAYRYPFQDVMSLTTKEKLLNKFPTEVTRLLKIQTGRENTGAIGIGRNFKFVQFTKLLKMIWWIPSIRRAIKTGLSAVTHENWCLGKADIYHTYLWSDYNIRGIKIDDRIKEYFALYDNDESKMPPRVQIKVG